MGHPSTVTTWSGRAGSVDRAALGPLLRPLAPAWLAATVHDIDLEALRARRSVLLLDLDHTLVPWRARTVDESARAWVARAKGLGFRLLVISNTRHPERTTALCEALGLEWVRGGKKPGRRIYRACFDRLRVDGLRVGPADCAAIGDQIFTDVVGANRMGIETILVRPVAPQDFVTTRLLRVAERAVLRALARRRRPV